MECSGPRRERQPADTFMKHLMATAAIATTLVWSVTAPARLAAQAAELPQQPRRAWPMVIRTCPGSGGVERMSGAVVRRLLLALLVDEAADVAGRAHVCEFVSALGAAQAKTLSDKDDPTLGCVPTAFGTLNVSLFDVGAVGQIVQTPMFVVMLTETYHGFQIIPIDGRPHRDTYRLPIAAMPWAIGRAIPWLSIRPTLPITPGSPRKAEYRTIPTRCTSWNAIAAWTLRRSRSRRPLRIPKVLTKPWVVPKQTLQLAPFDQIMQLACSDDDIQGFKDATPKQNPGKN